MRSTIFSALIFLVVSLSGYSQVTIDDFLALTYDGMPYRLYVPEDYDPGTAYPLVTFLHGAGEKGTDNISQISGQEVSMTFAQPENQAIQKCFVMAPQCPKSDRWVNADWSTGIYDFANTTISPSLSKVVDIINYLQTQYSIDQYRLYITGLSMGGMGTWDMISRYPDMFAAAIPVCGAADSSVASTIKDIPIRHFHGSGDYIVLPAGDQNMEIALAKAGAKDALYTEYATGHSGCWLLAYAETWLPEWLLKQHLCSGDEVSGILISESTLQMTKYDTYLLEESILPRNACDDVSWTSDNTAVVTVNDGLVFAVGTGEANVIVSTSSNTYSAICHITVEAGSGQLKAVETFGTDGSSESYNPAAAWDGDTTTFFDSQRDNAITGADFGIEIALGKIRYFPRENLEYRMNGGKFQGSVDGIDYTDIYTIPSAPAYEWTEVEVSGTYRYLRYLAPTASYGNVAEIEVYEYSGISIPTYTLTVINGTGSGDYEEGEKVIVSANTPADGYEFDKWTGDTEYMESETELIMPSMNITIEANYILSEDLGSIDEDNSTKLQVYPNPATNSVILTNLREVKYIQLINVSGQILQTQEVDSQSIQMNMKDFASGLYHIRFIDFNGAAKSKALLVL